MKYRYRNIEEMKDSGVEWIGNMPLSWDCKRIKNLYKINKDIVGDKSSKYKVLSLTLRGVIERDFSENFGKIPASFDGYQIINNNSILLCLFDMDVTPRISGFVSQVGIVSSAYTNISIINEQVNNKFYSYWFLKMDFEKILLSQSKSLRNTLTNDNFLNLSIITLELKEQEKIAKFLDEKIAQFDSIISKKEALIKKLEEAKKSLISEVVTGKVKVIKSNDGYELVERKKEEMKDSGVEWLGEIPKEWIIVKLKHLVSTKITDGPHETPSLVSNGVPFLSAEAILGNKISIQNMRGYITEKQYEVYAKKSKVYKGDILFCKSGSTTGKSALVEDDIKFAIWSPLAIIRANNKINNKNLFFVIQSKYFRVQVENYWTFGTQPNIGMGSLENLFIPYSKDIKTQVSIYNYLLQQCNKFEKLINENFKQIEKLKEAKQSLISEAVTGKIEILD